MRNRLVPHETDAAHSPGTPRVTAGKQASCLPRVHLPARLRFAVSFWFTAAVSGDAAVFCVS